MKNFKLYILYTISVLFFGCDEYLDINDDPNNATKAPLSGLMARTSFETGDNVQNLGGITSFYVQYLAAPNNAAETDVQNEVSYGQTWFELYDVMTDLSDMILLAQEQEATHYEGAGKILMALNLGLTVDMWGKIPYTEAFFAQTLNPKYDEDSDLYKEIQKLLDEGITLLESAESSVSLGDDDFIFEGDTKKWIKTAHALKARYLLHLSKTGEFDADAILSQVGMGLESNADDASVSYFTESINPWANVARRNANLLLGGWISEQLIETMDGTSYGVVDPRMPFMFGKTDSDEFVGTVNGAGRGAAAERGERSTLVEGTYYSSETSSLDLITYAEQKFIEAEAAFRKNDASTAYSAYIDGIEANLQKLGVDAADITTYLSDANVAVGSGSLSLELIFKEKYIALFLNPETWNDARRFDYQYRDFALPANHNPTLNGKMIRRVIYPDSETGRNEKQVPSVTLLSRVWWDKQ